MARILNLYQLDKEFYPGKLANNKKKTKFVKFQFF